MGGELVVREASPDELDADGHLALPAWRRERNRGQAGHIGECGEVGLVSRNRCLDGECDLRGRRSEKSVGVGQQVADRGAHVEQFLENRREIRRRLRGTEGEHGSYVRRESFGVGAELLAVYRSAFCLAEDEPAASEPCEIDAEWSFDDLDAVVAQGVDDDSKASSTSGSRSWVKTSVGTMRRWGNWVGRSHWKGCEGGTDQGPAEAGAAMARRAAMAVVTSSAIGPTQSSNADRGTTPALGINPLEGLKPTHPQYAAGTRTEPMVSVPRASVTRPAPTTAPEPPLDPPQVRVRSCGFLPIPKNALFVVAPSAASAMLSIATMSAPASRSARTTGASPVEMRCERAPMPADHAAP